MDKTNEDTTSTLLATIHYNANELWQAWLNGQKPNEAQLREIGDCVAKLEEKQETRYIPTMYI